MSKHIGIVGCSVEGAALCYRTVVTEGIRLLDNHRHPEVSVHNFALSDYIDHLADGAEDWVAVGGKVLESVKRLRLAGADFAICPDNTIHEGIDLVREDLELPFLHIAEVVAAAAVERGLSRLLVLGTRYTARSTYYERALSAAGVAHRMPDPCEIEGIDRIIWNELVWGRIEPGSLAYYRQVIAHHQAAGCDGVVLGCTEIPLLVNDADSPLPVLDSTRLLARAALAEALSDS